MEVHNLLGQPQRTYSDVDASRVHSGLVAVQLQIHVAHLGVRVTLLHSELQPWSS